MKLGDLHHNVIFRCITPSNCPVQEKNYHKWNRRRGVNYALVSDGTNKAWIILTTQLDHNVKASILSKEKSIGKWAEEGSGLGWKSAALRIVMEVVECLADPQTLKAINFMLSSLFTIRASYLRKIFFWLWVPRKKPKYNTGWLT